MNKPLRKPLHQLIPLAAGLLAAAGVCASEVPADAAAIEDEATQKVHCLQQTGSRIRTTEERPCAASPGQVITREQIERTGAITLSDAIRRSSASVN